MLVSFLFWQFQVLIGELIAHAVFCFWQEIFVAMFCFQFCILDIYLVLVVCKLSDISERILQVKRKFDERVFLVFGGLTTFVEDRNWNTLKVALEENFIKVWSHHLCIIHFWLKIGALKKKIWGLHLAQSIYLKDSVGERAL